MRTGTPEDWTREGERRALREWQQQHREPCGDCEWVDVREMCGNEEWILACPCAKHGGEDR